MCTSLIIFLSCAQKTKNKLQYLGQKPPSITPEIFAPNLISMKGQFEFGSVFNKDVTEFYYAIDKGNERSEIWHSKLEGEKWSDPAVLLSHEINGYNDPFLSPDENRLYSISKRTMDGKDVKGDYDIWYVERTGSGWSEAKSAGPNINTDYDEYYISFNSAGTMYFASNVNAPKDNSWDFDIYASEFKNGSFQKAIAMNDSINTEHYEGDVFMAPDESYVIFCAQRPDGLGRGDLYVSFKKPDGGWTTSKNMGAPVNSDKHELCPFVSQDGKYLFYTSNGDIYWVDTKVIENLRR